MKTTMPRGKRGKRKIPVKKNTKIAKSKARNTRNASKKAAQCTPESDGSPFKGFDSPQRENFIEPIKLFDDSQDENAEFDKLLNPLLRPSFPTRNIKTYSNKRKLKQEHTLLEFEDSKNRDKIIQWLNDHQNIFDRLTQTQRDNVNESEEEIPLTFDMPSVSQTCKVSSNKLENKTVRKTRRSPYKLRARSLEIQITKNGIRSRNKRHSLAGDTPSMENYHIEEVVTDDDAPIPATDAILLVNLMEDECLSTLEKAVLRRTNENKNKSVNGWDRIKVVNRTIKAKQPKQLKITLQSSQYKKGELLEHSEHLDELENHFKDKMEQLMKNHNVYSSQMTQQGTTVESVLMAGNNFIEKMRKLRHVNDNNLNDFQSVFYQLKNLFNLFDIGKNTTSVASVQTVALSKSSKKVQTFLKTTSIEVQTDCFIDCKNCANNNNKIQQSDKFVQTVIDKNSIEIQTDMLISTNVLINEPQSSGGTPTETLRLSDLQKLLRNQSEPEKNITFLHYTLDDMQFDTENFLQIEIKPKEIVEDKVIETSGTVTPSDIFPLGELENLINKYHEPEKTANSVNTPLDGIQFDTENFLKGEIKTKNIPEEKSMENVPPQSLKSLLVCSVSSKPDGNKGVKRLLSKSPVFDEENKTKRPCNKFINEDLSIAFDSCSEKPKYQKNEVIDLISDESDADFNEYLNNTMKKWNRNNGDKIKIESSPEISKTQLELKELAEKIRNATKHVHVNKKHDSEEFSSDSDVILMEAEKELDYFEAHLKYSGENKFRKELFKPQENKKFSESLFETIHNQSASVTITKENVDVIMKELSRDSDSENDKEVQKILSQVTPKKINILQNVVVKSADLKNEVSEDFILSGVDVVDGTPVKQFPSFSQMRNESFLDITLPPPLEFQDVEMENVEKENRKKSGLPRKPSPLRRPLTTVNKVTSTPVTQRNRSELISLSPIAIESNQTPGPIEMVQQSKFTPLTVVKTSQSQKTFRNSTTPKQKSILNFVRPSQESQESPTANRKPCISCSRINRDQVMVISALTNRKLATYSSSFSAKVTHMVVSANKKNRIKDHTIKSVSAIAAGIWVLNFGWVQECLAKNCIVPEDSYEVLDVSGIPGPQKSRLTRTTKPLLKGYKIHVSPPFLTTTLHDIENIIKMLGGKVVPSPEDLLDRENNVCLIITEGKATQDCDSEKFETWLEALRVVTVDLEWLSRSVGQYQLQSLIPFTLCSDDFIDTLGYPPELTSNVPVSFLQSTSSG